MSLLNRFLAAFVMAMWTAAWLQAASDMSCTTPVAFVRGGEPYSAGYCERVLGLARREYVLCFDKDKKDGTNACRQLIAPQPAMGTVQPENGHAYHAAIETIEKEIGSGGTHLKVTLWKQKDREPTEAEKQRVRDPKTPAPTQHFLYDPALPITFYELRYRLITKNGKAAFRPSSDTLKAINAINTD